MKQQRQVNRAPVAQSIAMKTGQPKIMANNMVTNVKHREYISDYSSDSTAFKVQRYAINPGLNATFPWLSSIANRFEFYRFKKLNFIYQPICATTTPGSVMLAIDFDAADPTPSNKIAIMSYRDAVRCAPWEDIAFRSEKSDMTKFALQKYTRGGAVPTGSDIKTYDIGAFFIASQSTPGTATTLGELYVEYDIDFYTPQIANSVANARKSQKTTIKIDANRVPSLVAELAGVANEPLAWIYNYFADAVAPYVDIALNLDGSYYFQAWSKYNGNLGSQIFEPPGVKPVQEAANNYFTFWNPTPNTFIDSNPVSTPVGDLYSRNKIVGIVDSQVSPQGNSSFPVFRISTLGMENQEFKLNLLPIDQTTARLFQSNDRWNLISAGPAIDASKFPLIPPTLYTGYGSSYRSDGIRARETDRGLLFTQEFSASVNGDVYN